MIRIKTTLITLVLLGISLPISTENSLKNYGVKNRPVGQVVLSDVVSSNEILRERAYDRTQACVPYVKQASRIYKIPANVILAILFEEGLHRKPIDLQTFGPAQLGIGELVIQGLPPRRDLLEDPEMAVYLLTRKLRRVQEETGSLQTAIVLHNGYTDYLTTIQRSARDPRLLEMLEGTRLRETTLV